MHKFIDMIFVVITVITTLPTTAVASDDPGTGERLYENWCVPCHGIEGGEPGTVRLGRMRGQQYADLLNRPLLPTEYLQTVVREGLGAMPAFRRSEIDTSNLDALIAYIQEQQARSVRPIKHTAE